MRIGEQVHGRRKRLYCKRVWGAKDGEGEGERERERGRYVFTSGVGLAWRQAPEAA